MMSIPNEDDWGNFYSDFDMADAHRIFFGKSNQEMQSYFSKNVMSRAQDIRFMPKIPFMYYIIGFSDFVLSECYGCESPSDVANCFISIIKSRADEDTSALRPIYGEIVGTLDFLVINQVKFDVDADIFGDFQEEVDSIKKKLSALS